MHCSFPAWTLAAAALFSGAALAAPLPEGELQQRCWQAHTRERTKVNTRELTEVSFSNLRDGFRVASPVLVQFAVRGMGVVPAGVQRADAGHHHLLVNRPLPTRISEPIPFDKSHLHFGKGQTETLVELPPGRHTLRLLFADHAHRPYFVFSREITLEVLGSRSDVPRPRIDAARFDETCQRWYEDEVSRPRPPDEPLHFTNVRAGEALTSPFNLRFGVEGFGVCAKGSTPAGPNGAQKAGHFALEVLAADGRSVQRNTLANGATQANLALASGNWRLRLRLLDDAGKDLLPAHELPVRVVAQEAL